MLFQKNDPASVLKRAIAAAVVHLKSAKRPERAAIREMLEDGLNEWKRVEMFAADRDKPVRKDDRGFIGPPPTLANKSPDRKLVNIILGRR